MKHIKLYEESAPGDYSTDEHAIAHLIKDALPEMLKDYTTREIKIIDDHKDLLKGCVRFTIQGENPRQVNEGSIQVVIDFKDPKSIVALDASDSNTEFFKDEKH